MVMLKYLLQHYTCTPPVFLSPHPPPSTVISFILSLFFHTVRLIWSNVVVISYNIQCVFRPSGNLKWFYLSVLSSSSWLLCFICPSVLPFALCFSASFLQNVYTSPSSTALSSCTALPCLLCLLIRYKAALCHFV